ncbi:hypothetical protein D3C71_1616810 [compost metagenome]
MKIGIGSSQEYFVAFSSSQFTTSPNHRLSPVWVPLDMKWTTEKGDSRSRDNFGARAMVIAKETGGL